MKLFLLFNFIFFISVFAQNQKSIHQIENEYYNKFPDQNNQIITKNNPNVIGYKPLSLSKVIYGFHPYWENGSETNYYFSLLTHIAYFSAEINTDGSFSNTRSWATANVIGEAQKYGKKIHLCVTLFTDHSILLSNSASVNNLISNIITQINVRNADGVNIDFEGMAASNKTNFKNFILNLGTSLKSINKELVVELPAVDWNGIFDNTFFTTVTTVVDYYFLMAYDYYWTGSTNAGPVAPITTGTSVRHVERSIDAYLSVGCSSSKLIAGVPYYGYQWPVVSNSRMANTSGTGISKIYSAAKTTIAGLPAEDKFFDDTYKAPWYRYQNAGQWYQCWYEDVNSLAIKYNLVKNKGIAGTGIWALGYDGTNTELWNLLKTNFASTPTGSNVVLDDFESGVGRFNQSPTFSGTTNGISTASTLDWDKGFSYNGAGSMELLLKDEPTSLLGWTVRILSGGGTISNNYSFSNSGHLGFWLKTSSAPSGAQTALAIDDGASKTLISAKQSIINDGQWHLYEWNLATTTWTILTGPNNILAGPTCTLDAIMFYAANNSPDWTLYFDDVSYNSTNPLPVEMISFDVTDLSERLLFEWETATEINNYGWEIERSYKSEQDNWSNWGKIGFVEGNGNSNSPKKYYFNLINKFTGENKFRLKQIDLDGNISFSKEILININQNQNIFLSDNYPNPFNPLTKINYNISSNSYVKLKVFDALGKEIAVLVDELQQKGNYTIDFDGSFLPSGMYFYEFNSGNIRIVKKMILMK